MKRYIKYGLLLIAVIVAIGVIFYVLKKPKVSVLRNIEPDVSYCFTLNKSEYLKQSFLDEGFDKDSVLVKLKAKIPEIALEIYTQVGQNKFGDMAIFGNTNDELNVAWIGDNEKKLQAILKSYKLHEKKFKDFNQIKISDNLFLNYKWPLMLISNYCTSEHFDFFNPKIKKRLDPRDLQNPATANSLVYGFITPDRKVVFEYNFIPLDGKAFVGLTKDSNTLKIFYVQPKVKLTGKLGLPKIMPMSHAVLSWPIDSQPMFKFKNMPEAVLTDLKALITKKVTHLYAEVLDTISTKEEKTLLDFDEEFRGRLKVFEYFKTYPGVRLEFIKTAADNTGRSRFTNLGLDILKLRFYENNTAYIIQSDERTPPLSKQNMPDYYAYANFNTLKTDPFWEPYITTSFHSFQLHAENLGKGSVFVITIKTKK